MYEWLAQDLAERGYVVLTYDVQGQGTSETLPHEDDEDALPFCNPFAEPQDGEQSGCPGVPSQQLSNFVVGTGTQLYSSPPRPTAPTATRVPPARTSPGLRSARRRGDKKQDAGRVPTTKLDSCWDGRRGSRTCSPSRGSANGLQNGSAFRVSWGKRLAGALALHVVGEHDVPALGEVLGQPLVHPLRALHRAGR